ncbi:MAG: hypothetical protein EBY20_00910, partial [Alphaproteobacteria bacterium]|nr:hypothetical protein [Alphaproteobacteria bacterium]
MNNASGSQYINPNDGTKTYITGIVLTNTYTNNGVYEITFPGETSPRWAYIYYNQEFANLQSDDKNSITAWYSNFSKGTNDSSVNFNIFLQAGVPSAPGKPTFLDQRVDNNLITVLVNYTVPEKADKDNDGSSSVINDYKINYSTSGSTLRSGGPFAQDSQMTQFGNNSTSNYVYNLYPDCSYDFKVAAKNNSTNQDFGEYSQIGTVTTINIPPLITSPGNIYFQGDPIRARIVSNSTTVSNLYLSSKNSSIATSWIS